MTNRRLSGIAGWVAALSLLLLVLILSPNYILPTPKELFRKLLELSFSLLWSDLAITIIRSVTAFLIALFLGISWAAIFPPDRTISRLANPSLLLLQAAPVIFWIVPLVLLLGSGNTAPVAASVFVVMPLIALEFRAAFELTSRGRREFWRHYVPYYPRRVMLRIYHEWRPHLAAVTGMGLLMSFKASVIAEWFAARNGIGRLMQQSFVLVDMASFLVYALVFLISALIITTLTQAAVQRIGILRSLFTPEKRTFATDSKTDFFQMKNICVKFGREKILEISELSLKRGEIIVLTGPSGCGKSTLARAAAGLLKPATGQRLPLNNQLCLVFQTDFLFPLESVLQNVSFHLGESEQKIAEHRIKQVGLESEMLAGNLSGGMRRRLALARGLCSPAEFLILDEPFAGLDEEAVRKLLPILEEEARAARGILLITHNIPRELKQIAAKMYLLTEGKLQFMQTDPN